MSLYQAPPETLSISGNEYFIDTDFRVWIEFQKVFISKKTDEEKAESMYDLMVKMGLPPSKESLEAMLSFYAAASTEKPSPATKRAQSFDFETDSEHIYSAFRGAYGIDLTVEKIHWWKFKALFKSLPEDCELMKIMRYRAIDIKDVPKNQKKFYLEMKARYALNNSGNSIYRTEEEMKNYVKKRFKEAQARMPELRSGE